MQLTRFIPARLSDPGALFLWAAVALLAFKTVWAVFRAHLSAPRGVPGPRLAKYTCLWELWHTARGEMHTETVKLHERYGPVVQYGPNKYSFNSAEAVRTIYSMSTSFPKASYYNTFTAPRAAPALFSTRDTREHARLRRTQASLYSMTAVKSYEPFVDTQNSILERKLAELEHTQDTVSLPRLLQEYAFDVIGEITFGESFHLMENRGPSVDVIGLIDISMIMGALFGIIPILWTPLIDLLTILSLPSPQVLFDIALQYLNQYRNSNKQLEDGHGLAPATFIGKIVGLQTQGKMSDTDALNVCVNNVVAGSDTTAISLNSALYHVYTIPHVLERLRTEIDTAMQKGQISDPITFDEAQKLPYLQAVISEALRIHPAVGVPLLRVAPEGGATIDGYYFPQGAEIGVNAWALRSNKVIYGEDAYEFNPDRWFEKSIGTTTGAIGQFAFGAGTRTCIGKNISLLEMTKVIPQIVRKFDIKIDVVERPWSLTTYWFVKQKYTSKIQLRSGETLIQ